MGQIKSGIISGGSGEVKNGSSEVNDYQEGQKLPEVSQGRSRMLEGDSGTSSDSLTSSLSTQIPFRGPVNLICIFVVLIMSRSAAS